MSDSAEKSPAESNMQWYVLKVQSNRERTIRDALERRIKREGLEHFFGEIVIPTERVAETKGGKKRVTERKLFPGYIMINMELYQAEDKEKLNEEAWYLVRDTSGVGDFTGAAGKPLPMSQAEIARMLGDDSAEEEVAAPKIKIEFSPGDIVKIKEGTFESFEGEISEIDDSSGKISVLIEIFGRTTPVELEYWQVERFDP